jgi:ABC-type transport system involved in cytochrome c biogenesis permease component
MEVISALFIALIVFVVYFIPTIVAFRRGHHNRWPIAVLNFFLGSTGIGWVLALVWSLTVVED